MVVTVLGLVAIFSLGFLWIGSTHRDRCLKAGNVGCSMLPWSGKPATGLFGPQHGYLLGQP